LDVELASLLDPKPRTALRPGGTTGRRLVQRAGEGQCVETHSYRQTYLATELLNKKMTPMLVEIRARTLDEFSQEFGGLIHHPGEEFTYVVEGEVDFLSELYAPVRLRIGDSIYFDSDMGHAYLKASDGPCRVISSCVPQGDHNERIEEMFLKLSLRERQDAPPTSHRTRRSTNRRT